MGYISGVPLIFAPSMVRNGRQEDIGGLCFRLREGGQQKGKSWESQMRSLRSFCRQSVPRGEDLRKLPQGMSTNVWSIKRARLRSV